MRKKRETDVLPVAVVGMGLRGTVYAEVLSQMPEAELAAVCDTAPERAAEAGRRFGARHFTDAAEMCAACRAEAVVVATPDFAHADAALAAARAGMHLLVEKPLATTLAEAVRIRDAVRAAGVHCMVAFENHWNPPIVAMKRRAEAGEFGAMISCASALDDRIDVPTRMLPWLACSTPGWFLMSHCVELAGWIAEQTPVRAQACGVKKVLAARGLDTYDAISALVEFDGGMVGRFGACWVLPESLPLVYEFRHQMVGERGSARADFTDQMLHVAGERFEHPSTIGVSRRGAATSLQAEMLREFVAALLEGRPPPCPADDGLVNVAAIEAIHESIRTRRPVDVRAPSP